MLFVYVAIAILCTVNSELAIMEYDDLNETEKLWHQDIISLTLGIDNISSSYSCLLSQRPCCSCMSECYSLGTCCIDAYFLQSPMPPAHYLDFMSRKVYTTSPSTCLPILVGLPGSHQVQRIMQVAMCPVDVLTGSANLTKQRLCETETPHFSEDGVINPTLVTQDQIFYRNQFCAECNGAYDSKRVNFTGDNCEILASARNSTSVTFKDLVNCTFKVSMAAPDCLLLPALHRPSRIGGWSEYSRNCSRDEYKLCFVYMKPVVDLTYPKPTPEPTYANRHCLLCLKNETIHQAGGCRPPTRPRTLIAFGYSVLVTFGASKGCEMPWTLSPTPFLALVGLPKSNFSGRDTYIGSVLSTVGSILSLVSLAFTICTVSAYTFLRTRSGKNIISLSIALMISDSLLLVSMYMNVRPTMCRAFAVLVHWSLLAQHLSCLVLAVSLAQTFLSPVKANQRNKRGFSRLGFGIWGVSGVFVSTCVLLDHYFKDVMQYGHKGICWIYSRKGRVYGYVVPAFGVLFINVILFFMTLRQIHKTRQAVQSVIKKDSTGDQGSTMWLAIKLCLLFGLLEVLGVVQLDSSGQASEIINTIFSTMYSVARSLRGFFLFASFTARKRVWRRISTSVRTWRADAMNLRTSVSGRTSATDNSFDLTATSSLASCL